MFLLLSQFPDLSLLPKKIAMGTSGANLYKISNSKKECCANLSCCFYLLLLCTESGRCESKIIGQEVWTKLGGITGTNG